MPARVGAEGAGETRFDASSWAVERGLLPGPPEQVETTTLSGGVSCEVTALAQNGVELVVKRARPLLAVADLWAAPLRRATHEAEVIGVFSTLTPAHVPPVIDSDPKASAIAIGRAPRDWCTWKTVLLEGNADPRVARTLGQVLGRWHLGTWDAGVARRVDDYALFEQLRLEPYFTPLFAALPEHSRTLARIVDTLRATRRCLVHGDFSPKNVLTGMDGTWVIDHEVGHVGDPLFDVAFLLHHLLLKAVHRADQHEWYTACAAAFLDGYQEAGPPEVTCAIANGPNTNTVVTERWRQGDGIPLGTLTGALLLARVHGKSTAEYLDDEGRRHVDGLGTALLTRALPGIDAAWDSLADRAAGPTP